jgi:hypothetical protein
LKAFQAECGKAEGERSAKCDDEKYKNLVNLKLDE